jgi:Tol biopolymer transport system component
MGVGRRLAAVAAAWLLASGAAAAAQESPPRAQIAYSHAGRLFVIAADGSDRRELLHRPGATAAEPAWAPDGQRLAFTRLVPIGRYDYRSEVWVADANGGDARRVLGSRTASYGAPAWSPDGRRLVLARYTSQHGRYESALIVVDLASGRRQILLHVAWRAVPDVLGDPAWSPDGRQIAYARTGLDRNAFFRPSLWAMRSDGTRRRRLAAGGSAPAWSPDSLRLAFVSIRDRNGSHREGSDEEGYNGELYVMNRDGTGQTRLTDDEGDEVGPDWSPDGNRIVFASDRNDPGGDVGENLELYSIAPDGGCLTWLTNGTPSSDQPDWRPELESADPGGCGAVDRPPRVEIPTGAAGRARGYRPYWLGPVFGAQLLSDFQADETSTYFAYDDCADYDGHGCPGGLDLDVRWICWNEAEGPVERELLGALGLFRFNGALVADWGSDGGVVLYTGTSVVQVRDARADSDDRLAPAFPAVQTTVEALRPYGADSPAPLPDPVLPQPLKRHLERTTRLYARLHSIGAVAHRLHVTHFRVRERLRIAQALGPLARLRTIRCPKRIAGAYG